jgi:hypothetical protein
MNRFRLAAPIGAAVATLLAVCHATAADFAASSVTFAPKLEAKVQSQYGAQEVPVLRSQVIDSVSAALKAAGKCTLTVEVVMQQVAPSHPTIKQQLNDPSLDPFRTRLPNAGAALIGHLRDAEGRELATVKYEHFIDEDPLLASPARDPWSDARAAIGQFADRVASACEHHSGGHPT